VILKTTPNVALFDLLSPVKVKVGIGEVLIVEAFPTTEPPEYI